MRLNLSILVLTYLLVLTFPQARGEKLTDVWFVTQNRKSHRNRKYIKLLNKIMKT